MYTSKLLYLIASILYKILKILIGSTITSRELSTEANNNVSASKSNRQKSVK